LTAAALALLAASAACGAGGGGAGGAGGGGAGGKEIKSGTVGRMTVTLANSDGVLRHGEQSLTVTFKDQSGKAVDVGSASLNFYMPAMGAMAPMNDAATLTTTPTPGVYDAKVKIEMMGEWQAQVAYEGPAGSGKGSFPVTAQ
jgi:hypothetical protein